MDCLQSWSLFLSEVKVITVLLQTALSKLSQILLFQTSCLSLRWSENVIATPFSTFSSSFNILHDVLLLTRVASLTLLCSFERGIVIPTSDSVFMNFCTLLTISRSPLFTRFFPPCSDIFQLWSTYLLQIIQGLTADAHTLAGDSSRLNCRPRRFKWTHPFSRRTKSGFCACAFTFQMLHSVLQPRSWRKGYIVCIRDFILCLEGCNALELVRRMSVCGNWN